MLCQREQSQARLCYAECSRHSLKEKKVANGVEAIRH